MTRPKVELKPEYAEIVHAVRHAFNCHEESITGAITTAIEICQELATKPQSELSDEELNDIFSRWSGSVNPQRLVLMRSAIAAHRAKQLEPPKPVTVRLRMANADNLITL